MPEYRNKGVAKNFLDCCLKYCKKNKLKKIILDVNETNLNAIKFYKKHNFIFSGRRKNYYRNEESFNDSFTMLESSNFILILSRRSHYFFQQLSVRNFFLNYWTKALSLFCL